MAKKHNSIEMWKRRLIAEISRDKKKAITLGVLLLVAVFFVGKILVESSPTEATAAATPAAIASAESPMSPGAGNAVPHTNIPRVEAPKSAAKGIFRDIFMPNPSIFPYSTEPVVVPRGESEMEAQRRRKRERIHEQGAELHLESTITGRVPIAIINGTVLGRDGVIKGFRIVEINFQACVLEKEGVVLNLTKE